MTTTTRPPTVRAGSVRASMACVALLLASALLALVACGDGVDETPSEDEYLEMVDAWMEHELTIRERAAIAAGQTSNEAFPDLAAETEALRSEIAAIEPPETCEPLRDAFLSSQEHFVDALTFLGRGEDFQAIDEIALANMAKQDVKEELERLSAEAR